jgi:hypothetical protein
MTPADLPILQPSFSQTVVLPPTSPKQISSLHFEPNTQSFVFDDGQTVFGYSIYGTVLWTLVPQNHLNGWTINGTDLYLQDGSVTCQFDITALVTGAAPLPVGAINLKTETSWSGQQSPAKREDFLALFSSSPTPDPGFSPPALWVPPPNGPFVVVIAANGHISELAPNLQTVRTSHSSQFPPDQPLAIFCVGLRDKLFLQYLSGGQVVTVKTPLLKVLSRQAPAGGAEHWLAVSRTGRLQNTSEVQPWIWMKIADGRGVFGGSCSIPDCQLYSYVDQTVPVSSVCIATESACLGGTLDGAHKLVSAPAFMKSFHLTSLFTLTTDGQNILFEKYKLQTPLSGSPQDSMPLFGSQIDGILTWLGEGGIQPENPFDANSTVVCLGAILEAMGLSDPVIANQLQAAGKQVGGNMVLIAEGSGRTQAVTTALSRLCAVPYTTVLDACVKMKYECPRVTALMKAVYNVPGQDLGKALCDRGYSDAQVGAAMHASAYLASDVLAGVVWSHHSQDSLDGSHRVQDIDFWHEQSNATFPWEVKTEGVSLAALVRDAGYQQTEIVSSFLANLSPTPVAPVFKAAFPDVPRETVRDLIWSMRSSSPLSDEEFTRIGKTAIYYFYGLAF